MIRMECIYNNTSYFVLVCLCTSTIPRLEWYLTFNLYIYLNCVALALINRVPASAWLSHRCSFLFHFYLSIVFYICSSLLSTAKRFDRNALVSRFISSGKQFAIFRKRLAMQPEVFKKKKMKFQHWSVPSCNEVRLSANWSWKNISFLFWSHKRHFAFNIAD